MRGDGPVQKAPALLASLLLALTLGALSAAGFEPLRLWPLGLIALAGLFWLTLAAPGRRRAFMLGWLYGVGHFSVGLNWIAKAFTYQVAMPSWLGGIAVVLLSLYLALFPALVALGLRWIADRTGPDGMETHGAAQSLALASGFGALWIITEWLRSWLFTGFAWNPLSVMMLSDGAHVLLPALGTYALSGLVAMAAACLALAGMAWRAGQMRAAWPAPALLVLLCLGAWGAGSLHDALSPDFAQKTPLPQITVVQPNNRQQVDYDPAVDAAGVARLARLSPSRTRQPRILFWPESAIPDYLESGYPAYYYEYNHGGSAVAARMRLAQLLGPNDLLVTGAVNLVIQNGMATAAYNGVTMLAPDASIKGFYAKAHLVPYGEYLPMREILGPLGLSRLVAGTLDFHAGPGPQSFALSPASPLKMGVQVCYEIIFSGQVVDAANRPAFLFNPSNDAWFGDWGPPQHLAQARMRAAEEGLPVIRATPTGISAVVDHQGRILAALPHESAGRIDRALPAARGPTLFSRTGNAMALLIAGLLGAICAIAIRFRRR